MKCAYRLSVQAASCAAALLAPCATLADESVWSSPLWFRNDDCRPSGEAPGDFLGRINTKDRPAVTISAITEPDGSKRVEFTQGADVYRFWSNIVDCNAESRRAN